MGAEKDIIKRTSKLYDEVIIAVVHNSSKKALFNLEERIEMIEYSTNLAKERKLENPYYPT